MSDDFIRDLRREWQSQDHDVATALQRLRRKRWTPHLALTMDLSACAVALAAGLWFAWVAAHHGEQKLLFALSAAVMLVAAPVLGVASLMARRRSLAWDAESSESLLRVGMRRVEASLRAIRVGYWHIAIVTVFVAVLWIVQVAGLIHAIRFLVLYTAVCLVVCVTSGLWMRWRTKQLHDERAAYLGLLTKLQQDGE